MYYKEIQVNKATQVCGWSGHWYVVRNGKRAVNAAGKHFWSLTQAAAIAHARHRVIGLTGH